MSNIPTAEEFVEKTNLYSHKDDAGDKVYYDNHTHTLMIEFAKLHVETALKEASKKAECCADAIVDLGHTIIEAYVEEDSILNAYPLTNIK